MKTPPALRRLLIAVRGRTETYVKPVVLPMYGLRGLAPRLMADMPPGVCVNLDRGTGIAQPHDNPSSWSHCASRQLSSSRRVAAVAQLLSTEFGGMLIGLYFTPSVALPAESGVNAAASPNRC
jgi:hypothetical protein